MTSNNDRGRTAENQTVRFLRSTGWPYAERRAKEGANDRGDITGVIGVTFQVKDWAKPNYPKWFKDVVEQAHRDNGVPVLVHKRRNQQAKNWDVWLQANWLMKEELFDEYQFVRVSFWQACDILQQRGY